MWKRIPALDVAAAKTHGELHTVEKKDQAWGVRLKTKTELTEMSKRFGPVLNNLWEEFLSSSMSLSILPFRWADNNSIAYVLPRNPSGSVDPMRYFPINVRVVEPTASIGNRLHWNRSSTGQAILVLLTL